MGWNLTFDQRITIFEGVGNIVVMGDVEDGRCVIDEDFFFVGDAETE